MAILPFDKQKHLGVVRITPEALAPILIQGNSIPPLVVEHGVPEDASLLGAWWDEQAACFFLLFEHPTFPPAPIFPAINQLFRLYEVQVVLQAIVQDEDDPKHPGRLN